MDIGLWPQPVHVATTITLTETAGGSGQSLPACRKDAEKKSKRAKSQGDGGRERLSFMLLPRVRMFTLLRLARLLFVFCALPGKRDLGACVRASHGHVWVVLAFRDHMLSHRDWCVCKPRSHARVSSTLSGVHLRRRREHTARVTTTRRCSSTVLI